MIGKSKALAIALLLIVLLMGGVAGAALDRMLVGDRAQVENRDRRDGERDRRVSYIDWLADELELSQEQRADIELLLENYREQVSAQWSEMRPRFEELKQEFRAAVRETLSEEQLAAYEALLAREAERRHNRRGRQ